MVSRQTQWTMHVIPHSWRAMPVFAPNAQQIEPSVAHFPSAGKFGATPHASHKILILLEYSAAMAAQPDDGYTIPLVET